MPATRDQTSWTEVHGDHADDVSYVRTPLAPTETPTDEVRTMEEAAPVINATDGAITAAKNLGVDLASVSGSGADGRITKADVEAAAE